MNTKKIVDIVLIVVIAVVIVIVAVVWYKHADNNFGTSGANGGSAGSAGVTTNAQGAGTSATLGTVPADVVAPNKGTAGTPASVAVPVVQGPGDPSGNVQYRSFDITVQNGVYTPDTVIVNQGDTVNLEVTAVDASYGFTQPDYGLSAVIPKGKTQAVQFQASAPGNFIFYCASCGGPTKGPVGHLMIVAK